MAGCCANMQNATELSWQPGEIQQTGDSVPKHVWKEDGVTTPLQRPHFAVQDSAPCPMQDLAVHLGQPQGRAHGLVQGQNMSGTT